MPRLLSYVVVRSGVVHLKDVTGGPMLCGVKASSYHINLTDAEPTCVKCIAASLAPQYREAQQ